MVVGSIQQLSIPFTVDRLYTVVDRYQKILLLLLSLRFIILYCIFDGLSFTSQSTSSRRYFYVPKGKARDFLLLPRKKKKKNI